MLQQDLC